MPSFRSGVVTRVLSERRGLQRVLVDLDRGEAEPAYVLTELIGDVAVGDDVVVNTTAVELGLGTGGWHVVHWNLSRRAWHADGAGHIMKLRYTSLQVDAGATEEHHAELADVASIDGMPVVVCGLHSQMAVAVAAIAHARPGTNVAYVMSDGGALPLALSDLVATLYERRLVSTTITAGHAFGGAYEAVNVASALTIARHVARADVTVVAIGPGIVGTATRLGHTGLDVAAGLDAAGALGGVPIAALRASGADERARHRTLSHHSVSALGIALRSSVRVAVPRLDGAVDADLRHALDATGISERHAVDVVDVVDPVALLDAHDLDVTSMGRTAAQERLLFACAAAAGVVATRHLP